MLAVRVKSASRAWFLVVGVMLVLSLVIGTTLWIRSDTYRINDALGKMKAVESVQFDDEPRSALEPILLVEVADLTAQAEIESILETTEELIDDDLAHSARVSTGTAQVQIGSEYRADISDAAQFLTVFRALKDGRVDLHEKDLTFIDGTQPPLTNALEWLGAIEEEGLDIEDVRIEDDEGWNVISISRLQANHREVLESLGEWDRNIDQIVLEENSLTIRTPLTFADLGPLADATQASARIMDPESPRVSLETPEGRTLSLGDDAPAAALELSKTLEADGWEAQRITGELMAIDVSATDGRTSDPSRLPDLVETLGAAGLSRDAVIRVDEGNLFWGKLSDLDGLAPLVAQAHSEGYVVRWTNPERNQNSDARIWVEMPRGHSLSEDSELVAAIGVARSVPWPGTGSVTLRTAPEPGGREDVQEVTLQASATGTAEDVLVDPDRLPGEDRVRETWDSTATTS